MDAFNTFQNPAVATATYASTPEVPDKTVHVHRIATELFEKQTDWVSFFRTVLGVEGIVRQMFKTPTEMMALEQSTQYADIQQMLAKLRERGATPVDDLEPTRVITVRLPKSLHESLRNEAHEKKTSMNKLCISKLLQVIDEELIPSD